MNWSLLGLFGAGLGTFLSPCVLPLAPILIASWATSDSSKWGRVLSTTWFALGFTITFVALGATASAASSLIAPAKPFLFLAGAIILGGFALRMLGIINGFGPLSRLGQWLRLPDVSTKAPKSIAGLVFGLIFGLSWTPCVGPVLGAVLTYVASQQSSAIAGAKMLFVFSLGISLPLLVLAYASEHARPLLARIRSWIPKIEYAMGLGLLMFALSLANQARIVSASSTEPRGDVTAIDANENRLTLGTHTPGKTRMVFFYSENCPICHAMESFLPRFETDCASSSFGFSKVNVDLPANAQAAERYSVRAVPTVSVLNEDGREIVHLVGYQTESRLREAAKAISGLLCASKSQQEAIPPVPSLFQENQTCTVGASC